MRLNVTVYTNIDNQVLKTTTNLTQESFQFEAKG